MCGEEHSKPLLFPSGVGCAAPGALPCWSRLGCGAPTELSIGGLCLSPSELPAPPPWQEQRCSFGVPHPTHSVGRDPQSPLVWPWGWAWQPQCSQRGFVVLLGTVALPSD